MRWEGAWGDRTVPLGQVHGIVRHGGSWFIAQQGEGLPAVVEFTDDGRRVAAWGEDFGAGAHGLRLDGDSLWLTDHRAGRVVQFSCNGQVLSELPAPRANWQPTEIACAPDGRRYVADGYGSGYIDVFTADNRHLMTFGGPSSRTFSRCAAWEDPGFLSQPHGLCVLQRRGAWEVLVADRRHNRLQAFTLDGVFRQFLHGGVRYPCTVVPWGSDRLVVPDLYGCVHVLDHDGNCLERLGDSPQIWDQPGWPDLASPPIQGFVAPHCVWPDPDGTLTVGEWTRPGRLVRLRPS
jgi:hypothetical protein